MSEERHNCGNCKKWEQGTGTAVGDVILHGAKSLDVIHPVGRCLHTWTSVVMNSTGAMCARAPLTDAAFVCHLWEAG